MNNSWNVSLNENFIRATAPAVGFSGQELAYQLERIEFFDGSVDEVIKIGKQIADVIE